MADDRRISADEVASRAFSTSFRGLDPAEVRAWLSRVSDELRRALERESALLSRVSEAEERAAHPEMDEDTLLQMLGEETARVMKSAREAATDLRGRAEENVRQLLKDAHEEAKRVRASADAVLAETTTASEAAAAAIHVAAEADAEAVRARARAEAERMVEEVKHRAKEMLAEAQAARERILGDLSRKRRVAAVQVEQLRAGRDRLLEAYRMVRSTLDDVTDELQRAEAEARMAAETAGRRAEDAQDAHDHAPAGEDAEPVEAGPKPEGEAAPGPEAQAPDGPALVTTTITADERRSNSLRILRRPKSDSDPEDAPAVPPIVVESVRVIEPEAETTTETTTEGTDEASEEDEHPHRAEVEDLFARIRADRADSVAKAHEVLAGEEGSGEAGAEAAAADVEQAPAPQAETPEPAVGNDDERALQRRDEAVNEIQSRLARKLKRSLQDEQNDVLDRLRNTKGKLTPDAVIPSAEAHAARHIQVAGPFLAEAASAGSRFAGAADGAGEPDMAELAAGLAEAIVGPLRRQLTRALDAAGEEGEHGDPAARVGVVYREWKGERIETVAGDAVLAAFGRGQFQALPDEAPLHWVVDDEGHRCPDCDDNALAGPVPKGQEYPTGQQHPPAHSGCRCLVLPA